MINQTQVLTQHGMSNAAELVKACAFVGIPTYIGAAFAEHESGGKNVYGHDSGGAMCGAGNVTRDNYATFLSMVRAGHTSNGVGPMQITYPGYFKPNTAEVAALYDPYANFVFGLKIIKAYLNGNYSDANLDAAGQKYNSGSAHGAPGYGKITVALCKKWRALLGPNASTPTPTPHTTMGTLQRGATGSTVAAVQAFLMRVFPAYAGPIKSSGGADGVFGVGTERVVREFQARSHLVADGVIGPKTWAALRANGYR